jgi:glutamate carboxypeptidase
VRSARSWVVILAACTLGHTAFAQLNDTEQRIVAAVKSRSTQALDLLERAARINSGTLNPEGVREVGQLFRAELDTMGFATRWADMPPEMQRGGHLVAERTGSQGQRLLLLGHLDTVFDKGSAVAAWDRRGNRVRGQGVADMKGGDVVLLEALRALHAVGALQDTRIAVLMTGDEERVGNPAARARADLVELAKRSDAALSFEAATQIGRDAFASISRRSAGGWTLKVSGRPGHSAGVFSSSAGYGAIYEAARILNAFREQLPETALTFNPGLLLGGTQVTPDPANASGTAYGRGNVIAAQAEVRGDLRYLSPEQGERARARMKAIVAQHLPGTSASIAFSETYPPMPPTDAGRRLLAAYSKASEDAGLGDVREFDPSGRGAGDIQFAAPYVPGLDGLGAAGRGSHTDEEDLEIASLERGAIRAALLIYRLTRP